jgi:hypothetical protein
MSTTPPAKRGLSRNAKIGIGLILGFTLLVLLDHCGDQSRGNNGSAGISPSQTRESGCGDVGPTCDAVPKVDGIYRVAGDGLFDTGILSGWIETDGPRAGSSHCTWTRLSGPTLTIDNVIETKKTVGPGLVKVLIQPTDVAFASFGCQPWHRP